MYRASLVATVLAIILLLVMRPLERRLDQRWRRQTVSALYNPGAVSAESILAALRTVNLHVTRLAIEPQNEQGKERTRITLMESGSEAQQNALQTIAALDGVESASSE